MRRARKSKPRHENPFLKYLTDVEAQGRAEREAQRQLGRQLVDIGYKALAKELHPDTGGSQEAMARLNRARDHIKRFA